MSAGQRLNVVRMWRSRISLLLYATFSSIRRALLIYTGIPFAVVGGIIALFMRGMSFSISAGVGFIALFGVAVLNGVVMVSYTNKVRDEGLALILPALYGWFEREHVAFLGD